MSVQIPEDVATLAGGPEPIGPPGEPPLAPAGPMGDPLGGGPPPDLAGALGGGPGGAPEEGGDEIDLLSQMLDTAMQYMQVASDDIEKAKMLKAAQIVQDLLASNQKEAETAAGIGPAQKGMAKALQGGGGGF